MTKVTITTDDGIVIEEIDASEYNLDRPIPVYDFLNVIVDAVRRADAREEA